MCFVLFARFARVELLAGIAKTTTGKAFNKYKTLGRLGLDCVQIFERKCSFPNSHYLDFSRAK